MEKEKRFRPTVAQYRELEEKVQKLTNEVSTLNKSKGYLEGELKKEKANIKDLTEKYNRKVEEIRSLKSRNMWQRIFNR